MTYDLNQEQREVQDLVRRVARERVAGRASEIDASAEYPQDMFDLLAELGLLYGFQSEGELIDIGTPERYRRAPEFFRALAGDSGNGG